MGLDVVMIGLNEIRESVQTDAQMAAMVKWVQENVPEAQSTHIGEPEARVAEGNRVGAYSDLHVLRGLALRLETKGRAGLESATEEELSRDAEAFYQTDPPQVTRFTHLVDHSDSDGVYIPLPLAAPVTVTGTLQIDPEREPEDVNVSIGSSEALLAELDELGSVIGLPGDLGDMGEDAFEAAIATHRWPTAAYVWGVLHYYARESVRARTLIAFC